VGGAVARIRVPMPLILILRFFFSLLSFAILGVAAYCLWRWYDGVLYRDAEGVLHRIREDWPLWLGLGALAWSFAGGLVLRPILAGKDRRVLKAVRSQGRFEKSPTGSSLYVEMHGDVGAPPIILTHGWGLDSTIWAYTVEDLATRFRVIIWDLPGLGRSKGDIGLDSFAADLRAVVNLAGDQPAVLVGHSIGGMSIQTLARNDPAFVEQRVAGIVLLNTTFTNPLETMILSPLWKALRWPLIEPLMWLAIPLQALAWLSAWQSYLSGSAHLANRLGFGRYVTHSQLNATTLLGTRNSPASQARGNLAMFRWDATGALARVSVPVLVIAGSVDIVTEPRASRLITESAVRAKLLVVDGVNHMGFLERYDTYNEAISNFANGLDLPEPETGRSLREPKDDGARAGHLRGSG
jgi:pimeloyl-ACP methyl ester carboxylesterase